MVLLPRNFTRCAVTFNSWALHRGTCTIGSVRCRLVLRACFEPSWRSCKAWSCVIEVGTASYRRAFFACKEPPSTGRVPLRAWWGFFAALGETMRSRPAVCATLRRNTCWQMMRRSGGRVRLSGLRPVWFQARRVLPFLPRLRRLTRRHFSWLHARGRPYLAALGRARAEVLGVVVLSVIQAGVEALERGVVPRLLIGMAVEIVVRVAVTAATIGRREAGVATAVRGWVIINRGRVRVAREWM